MLLTRRNMIAAPFALAEKTRFELAKRIQVRFYEVVPYVLWGQFVRPVATRAEVSNIGATFIPVFWNVEKA
jgi:peptide/nickel transport system substrate-binding protein